MKTFTVTLVVHEIWCLKVWHIITSISQQLHIDARSMQGRFTKGPPNSRSFDQRWYDLTVLCVGQVSLFTFQKMH